MKDLIVDTGINTTLFGFDYGQAVFNYTVNDPEELCSGVRIYFHSKIRSIDRSFVEGFLYYLTYTFGKEWIKDNVIIYPDRFQSIFMQG